jgi:hypothetical protein
MGSLGTIATVKEQAQTSQPLMLAEFAMPDGTTTLRLSTHDLTATAFHYGGHAYLPRILNQDMAAFQLVSQQGVSIPPTISLKLADADKLLWGYEQAIGFRGAILTIRFVFFQAGVMSPLFSSDSIAYGPFLCSAASNVDDISLTIPAGSKLNMEQIQAPFVHIQQTCPWSFPSNTAQRADGAGNELSEFYQCGYSPDVATGSGGCGNYQSGSTPYASCGYSKGDCVARGMYSQDSSARKTGRFGGMQFQPPTALKSRSYVTGNWQEIYNSLNDSKYGDFVPMVYGTQWVDCPIIVSTGDANMAKFEVLVCLGQVTGIDKVVLNDTLIPCAKGVEGTTYPVADVSFCWRCINNGARSGAANTDSLFDGKGDPYGSYCVLEIVVPVALASSSSAPRVQALTHGPMLQVFQTITAITVSGGVATVTVAGNLPPVPGSVGQFTISGTGISGMDKQWTAGLVYWNYPPEQLQFTCGLGNGTYTGLNGVIEYPVSTTRPPWVLLDLLLWSGWNLSDINIASFIAADAICAVQVSYTDQNGNTLTKDRYKYQNVLRQRRSVGQVVRGILGAMNAVAVNNAGGALILLIKQTLADQQPALPAGSNYATAVSSIHAGGGAGNGYVAYAFDESDVIRDNEGKGKPKFAITQRPNTDLPALSSVQWQDEDNQYVVDSLTVADLPALARVSQNTTAAAPAEGFANYDQVRRILNTFFAENAWGNPRNDPGGTLQVSLTTTFKGVELTVGQIVLLSWAQASISLQPFRILQIKPSTNFETCDLLLQWHSDTWYTDAFGQATTPGGSGSGSGPLLRAPYPVFTGRSHYGLAADPLHNGEKPNYTLISDSLWQGQATQAKVFRASGVLPVNSFSTAEKPPFVPLQGSTSSTGGAIAGGQTIYVGFAAEDSAGKLSPLCSLVQTYVPSGTNTNTVTVANIQWATGTSAYHAWIGSDPQRLYYVGRVAGLPSSVTFALSLNAEVNGDVSAPDQTLSGLRLLFKRVMRAGAWGGVATGRTSSSITVTGAGWTTNQWAGRIVSMVGLKNGSTAAENPPGVSWLITGNSADTLSLNGSYGPDPTTLFSTSNGDLAELIIRAQATAAAASSITDTGLALTASVEIGRLVRIIAGTGVGQVAAITANTTTVITIQGTWPVTPDTTSVFWIEEAGWIGSQDFPAGSNANPFAAATQFAVGIGYPQQYLMICPFGLKADGTASLLGAQSVAIRDFFLWDQTDPNAGGGTATIPDAAQVTGFAGLNSIGYVNGVHYFRDASGGILFSIGIGWAASTDTNWASEELLLNDGTIDVPLGSTSAAFFTSGLIPYQGAITYTVKGISVNKAGVWNLSGPSTASIAVDIANLPSSLLIVSSPTITTALANAPGYILVNPANAAQWTWLIPYLLAANANRWFIQFFIKVFTDATHTVAVGRITDTTNAQTTSGRVLHFASTTIGGVPIIVGMSVTGTHIPADATVASVTSNSVTISADVTGTVANGATIIFEPAWQSITGPLFVPPGIAYGGTMQADWQPYNGPEYMELVVGECTKEGAFV